jgi:uncharacterized protein (DUF952 family)
VVEPGAAHYHLVPLRAWEAQLASGRAEWSPESLAREGFVHLSFAHQLAGTLELHFEGVEKVALLELDPARLEPQPVLESARQGELFPHLYAPLPMAAVVRTHVLRRGAHGFVLPPDVAPS